MKHIIILVTSGNAVIVTIIAPYNLLRMANSYYKPLNNSREDYFNIDLLGLSNRQVQYQDLFQLLAEIWKRK